MSPPPMYTPLEMKQCEGSTVRGQPNLDSSSTRPNKDPCLD